MMPVGGALTLAGIASWIAGAWEVPIEPEHESARRVATRSSSPTALMTSLRTPRPACTSSTPRRSRGTTDRDVVLLLPLPPWQSFRLRWLPAACCSAPGSSSGQPRAVQVSARGSMVEVARWASIACVMASRPTPASGRELRVKHQRPSRCRHSARVAVVCSRTRLCFASRRRTAGPKGVGQVAITWMSCPAETSRPRAFRNPSSFMLPRRRWDRGEDRCMDCSKSAR